MKNQVLWKTYDDYTKGLTESCRKLAFAGIAISWIFTNEGKTFPPNILFGVWFIVLFFIADILQYFFGAILVKIWTEKQEKKFLKERKTIDVEYDKPKWLDIPSFICWVLKTLFILTGYVYIGLYIFKLTG